MVSLKKKDCGIMVNPLHSSILTHTPKYSKMGDILSILLLCIWVVF